MIIKKLVTGGQTGTDRAMLDVALELGIPCGGWCPAGRLAEDGVIDARYPLTETPLAAVEQRTEWNARDSDGTLILTFGEPTGGTLFTVECAERYSRPHLIIDLDSPTPADLRSVVQWIEAERLEVMNVAGPRESLSPGRIYVESYNFLKRLLS